jgi:hypothetical protein
MLISVVIPTRNRPQLLLEAVNSVANQTYSHYEVIIVDDASYPPVDRSLVKSVIGKNLVFIRQDLTQGIGKSKNVGVRAARGDIIAILDDDDLLVPHALESIADIFRSHSELGCVFMGVEPFGAFSEGAARNRLATLQRLVCRVEPEDHDGLLCFPRDCFQGLIGCIPIDLQRPAAKREVWGRNGGFIETALFAEGAWTLLTSLDFRIALTKEPLTRWRIHGQNFGWPAGMTEIEIATRNIANAICSTEGLYRIISQRPDIARGDIEALRDYMASLHMDLAYAKRKIGLWMGVPHVYNGLRVAPNLHGFVKACKYFLPSFKRR